MRVVIVAGILVCAAFLGCSANRSAEKPGELKGPVKLTIIADPRQGFAPVAISFKAQLSGASETDPAYYCLQEEWDFGDGSVSSDKPNCEPYAAGSKVTREFFVEHVYQNEGIYTAKFKLGDKLRSNPVAVNVLENRTGAPSGP